MTKGTCTAGVLASGKQFMFIYKKQEKKTVFILKNAKTGNYKSCQHPTCGYASGARPRIAKVKINSG
jgi:hypothetical protein